jgi:hypothetical protein
VEGAGEGAEGGVGVGVGVGVSRVGVGCGSSEEGGVGYWGVFVVATFGVVARDKEVGVAGSSAGRRVQGLSLGFPIPPVQDFPTKKVHSWTTFVCPVDPRSSPIIVVNAARPETCSLSGAVVDVARGPLFTPALLRRSERKLDLPESPSATQCGLVMLCVAIP